MVFKHRFALGLAGRLALLMAALAAVAATVMTDGLVAARIVAVALAAGAFYALWRYVRRTNVEVARFVEAVQFGDLAQRFSRPELGSGFTELGEALDAAIRKLRDERALSEDRSRYFEALVDDTPVPLLTVDEAQRVEPVNKSARRLFARHSGVHAADYAAYGDEFAAVLMASAPDARRSIQLEIDGAPVRAVVSTAELRGLARTLRLVAVQPIQRELSRAEVATQTDLVRVLTHEIMNSMTPVTSLARSAAALVAAADTGDDPAIADARAAVETLARRADGVMHFVETYRQVSRTPELHRQRFSAASWGRELERLFVADWPQEHARFALAVSPPDFVVDVDPDLMTQVVINLMRNAAEAAVGHAAEPAVSLAIRSAKGRLVIEVEDNGPGLPESIAEDVFLPFFTTKPSGTGVGLSLARQIVVAHGGTVAFSPGGTIPTQVRIVI